MPPFHSTLTPLRPFPAPSLPPFPTFPILLPPLTLLCILLLLYIHRPPTIVPTRPMATIKTPLLSGTTRGRTRGRRGERRVVTYGVMPECDWSGKRPRLVRRDEEDVDTSPGRDMPPSVFLEQETRLVKARMDSVPTLVGQEGESGDEQGPGTPEEGVGVMLRDTVGKGVGKGVNVLETEVVETPVEERGMGVGVVCV